MSSSKSKKNEPPKARNWPKIVLIIIVCISILILTYFLYQKYLDHRESQRFVAVKMDVIELTKELNQVNEDINWQEHSTCDESYQGWYVAGIHCDVASRVSVPLTAGYSVDNLMRMYDPIFDRQNHFHRDADDYYISPNFPDKHEPGYSSQAFWSERGDMKCRLYYAVEDPVGDSPAREVEMSFMCSDRAREAWFTLQ